MTTQMNVASVNYDLLTVNNIELSKLNATNNVELMKKARDLVSRIEEAEFLNIISHLAKLTFKQPNFATNGFNGVLGNLLIAYFEINDVAAFHNHLLGYRGAENRANFLFSTQMQSVLSTLTQTLNANPMTTAAVPAELLMARLIEDVIRPATSDFDSKQPRARGHLMYHEFKGLLSKSEELTALLQMNLVTIGNVETTQTEEFSPVEQIPLVQVDNPVIETVEELDQVPEKDKITVVPGDETGKADKMQVLDTVIGELGDDTEEQREVTDKAKALLQTLEELQAKKEERQQLIEEEQEQEQEQEQEDENVLLAEAIALSLETTTSVLKGEMSVDKYEEQAEQFTLASSPELINLGKQMLLLAAALTLLTLALATAGASATVITISAIASTISASTGAAFFAKGRARATTTDAVSVEESPRCDL